WGGRGARPPGRRAGGGPAALAGGGLMGVEAMFGGPVSGASMNPARSLAPAVVSGHLAYVWVYLLAPVVGSAIGVGCWCVTRGKGRAEMTNDE
ncbi:MAG: aquaporin, partial [Phycisphaerae bacterium]